MTRLGIDITDELAKAIRAACEHCAFGPAVENWLWERPEVQEAAKRLGVTRKARRHVGQQRRRELA